MRNHLRSYMFGVLSAYVLFGAALMAQESYTVPASGNTTAQQQADFTAIISGVNEQTCVAMLLSPGCTQAQACVTAKCNSAGGASCTLTQARAAGCPIWPNVTSADRSQFLTFGVASPYFQAAKISIKNRLDHEKAIVNWKASVDTTGKNTICTSTVLNLGTGCDFLNYQ